DPPRLGVLVVDPRVADVRSGLHHDLPVVGRVGERLLVAGHAGREDHLAVRLAERAVCLAAERPAVLEHQHRRLYPLALRAFALARGGHRTALPSSTVGSPRRNVASTRAGSVMPAYGVLRLRLASSAGSTVHRASGSTRTRCAAAPAASRPPWPGRAAIRAGRVDIRSATSRQPNRPVCPIASTTTDSAVCRPST